MGLGAGTGEGYEQINVLSMSYEDAIYAQGEWIHPSTSSTKTILVSFRFVDMFIQRPAPTSTYQQDNVVVKYLTPEVMQTALD